MIGTDALKGLIAELGMSPKSNRELELAIGAYVGWRRQVEYETIDGRENPVERRVYWVDPSGGERGRVPYFTASVNAAYWLVNALAPGSYGGVSWGDGKAKAQVNCGPVFEAATPALALCMAALSTKLTDNNATGGN